MKERYVLITDNCCECHNCFNICNANAIAFVKDELGTSSAYINVDKCINCKLCMKVCSGINIAKLKLPTHSYAAVSKSKESVNSTSGGVFYELANYIISKNGSVVGAAYDENLNVVQKLIRDKESLTELQGSKYVKSDVSNSFNDTVKELQQNRYVLYSGTPCQIASLYLYLNLKKVNFDKLITVDIICHGTPPAQIFQDSLKYLSSKKNGKIVSLTFRDKFFGHKHIGNYVLQRKYDKKKYKLYSSENSYYFFFLKGYLYNKVCYSCNYAQNKRLSDITIGDFWGIKNELPLFFNNNSLDENTSVSSVMINTSKGKQLFEKIEARLLYQSVKYEQIYKHNPQLNHPVNCDENIRNLIIERYIKDSYSGVQSIYNKIITVPQKYLLRFSSYIPIRLKNIIKNLIFKMRRVNHED